MMRVDWRKPDSGSSGIGWFVFTKQARVLEVRVMSRDWKIYTHENHVPWFRTKMAVALVRHPDEHFCRLYPVEARQGYTGGGTWEKAVTSTPVDGVQVGRCK